MRTACPLFTLLLAIVLVGCSETLPTESLVAETESAQIAAYDAATSLAKAERQEYSILYDLEDEEPFIECRGELMKFHGVLTINIREQTTPSGNLLVRGWIDYGDDHWAEGTESHNVWTLRKGLNPYTETLKGEFYSEEDFWVQNWTIIEWYENPELGDLKLKWWGHLKFDKDGNFTIYRDNVTCK